MNFTETLQAAVGDFAENGYDSQARLEEWIYRIRQAAEADMVPDYQVQEQLRATLGQVYTRLVNRGGVLGYNPGASRYTLERLRPQMKDELSRRVLASANLIKLNRERAIEETLQRFSGWATSVPMGGSKNVDKREVKAATRKELAQLKFRVRRVHIDQGHKLAASISQIVANGSGAVAAVWHQHHTRYPRETHTRRDGKVYLIRDSWAHAKGLVKPGPAGYLDEVTQPGEEVYCRCTAEYINSVGKLPSGMLTAKGKAEVAAVRERLKAA